jgi:hypothetical protein
MMDDKTLEKLVRITDKLKADKTAKEAVNKKYEDLKKPKGKSDGYRQKKLSI